MRAARSAGHNGPLTGALSLEFVFLLRIPKSRPRILRTKRQAACMDLVGAHAGFDKLGCAALDAMTGVVLPDDAQIIELEEEVRRIWERGKSE